MKRYKITYANGRTALELGSTPVEVIRATGLKVIKIEQVNRYGEVDMKSKKREYTSITVDSKDRKKLEGLHRHYGRGYTVMGFLGKVVSDWAGSVCPKCGSFVSGTICGCKESERF